MGNKNFSSDKKNSPKTIPKDIKDSKDNSNVKNIPNTPNKNLPVTPLMSGAGYTTCLWNEKEIKKMIYAKQIAPLYQGLTEGVETRDDLEECPICLLFYEGGLNRLNCCKQSICSECYLQIKKPPYVEDNKCVCPFCSIENFNVTYRGNLSEKEIESKKEEQRKVKELEEKMRLEELKQDEERKRKREEEKLKLQQQQQQQNQQKENSQENVKTLPVIQNNPPPIDNNLNEDEIDEEMRIAIQLSLKENKPNTSQNNNFDNDEFQMAINMSLNDN